MEPISKKFDPTPEPDPHQEPATEPSPNPEDRPRRKRIIQPVFRCTADGLVLRPPKRAWNAAA